MRESGTVRIFKFAFYILPLVPAHWLLILSTWSTPWFGLPDFTCGGTVCSKFLYKFEI